MVKIKTKKEMTLSELVEYGFNNPKKIRGKIFKPQSFDSFWNPADVRFSDNGCAVNVNGSVTNEDVYTIEIEEEITEDTVIRKIAELNLCGYDQHEELFMNENKSVKQLLSEEETNNKAFYIMNDNLTMTLIWTKEKGLVE